MKGTSCFQEAGWIVYTTCVTEGSLKETIHSSEQTGSRRGMTGSHFVQPAIKDERIWIQLHNARGIGLKLLGEWEEQLAGIMACTWAPELKFEAYWEPETTVNIEEKHFQSDVVECLGSPFWYIHQFITHFRGVDSISSRHAKPNSQMKDAFFIEGENRKWGDGGLQF